MSITDELRKYSTVSWNPWPAARDRLFQMCDHIDAEYQKAIRELNNLADTSVPLPVDADGEYIRIGDVMENLREDLEPQLHHRFKVYGIQYREYGQECALTEDGYPSILYRASECRHYHAPTVEDVLRGVVTLCHNMWKEGSPCRYYDVDDVMESGNIADFAAKLRLAEGEDE